MGGQAFASRTPPLFTPRMPVSIYNRILNSTCAVLQQYFSHVASAIEAPGKTSYGDLDILLHGPLSVEFDHTRQPGCQVEDRLATVLNAKAWIKEKGNPPIFALPWPSSSAEENGRDGKEEKFVQVDVKICATEKSLKWELFHHAHGDLWNILGTTIRPFGLTVDSKALFLRIPEIELLDRKKSKILLTDEPSRILMFLGLDEKRYWESFGDEEELFRYATTCRMFRVREIIEGEQEEVEAGDVVGVIAGQEGGEQGKKKLKHNDRQRMTKRPMFKKWIDEFIPKCREEGNHFEVKVSREQVRDEAFDRFGVKDDYFTRLHDFQLSRHLDALWREVLKGTVPLEDVNPQFRAAAIRTLKGIIFETEPFEGKIVQASKRDEQGFYDVEVVRQFVAENWRRAGELGWKRQEERAMEGMKAKEEQKRKAAEEQQKSEKKGTEAHKKKRSEEV